VTDYAWEDLEIERRILLEVGATLVAAESGSEEELVDLSPIADGILTNWKKVTQRVIGNATKCKVIGRYGVGLDNIDVQFATKMGIVVTNVPAYCLEEVSDHAIALLLALARKIAFYDRAIKNGEYQLSAGAPLFRIKERTLGIVGYGKIGKLVCQKARTFGLRVIVYDRNATAAVRIEDGVEYASFAQLLRQSDYISIHAPLTAETRHLFNLETFRKMKPTAFIINTARGDIVDRDALVTALDDGLIAGAGLDVLSQEPPGPNDPLVLHPRTIVTPHAAFNSVESVEELRKTAASQMTKVLSGKVPDFVTNPAVFTQTNLRVNLDVQVPQHACL
jgi:D-3-phosphoglycerate dehydrogenase / 2-oxoglutarate reductase